MSPGQSYRFGEFRLDVAQQILFRGEDIVPLTPKAFETLLLLIQNRGRVVAKALLLKQIWPKTFVEEGSLTRNISTLRRALGDTGNGATIIETIPKRGYRFIAPISADGDAAPEEAQPAVAEADRSASLRHPYRALWLLAAAMLAIALAGFLLRDRIWPRAPRRIKLVVLPVQNLTGDPEREYISDGLTEEMIAQLGSLDPERLGVIARTSSMAYKGTGKKVDQISREVGADYVVESSLRGTDDSIRVTVKVVRAQDQTEVWAQSYDRVLDHLVMMQSEIARAIAHSISLKLPDAVRMRLTNADPVNPVAYKLYLKGRFYWNTRDREGLYKSIDYYNQALQLEPANARAYAGLADSYNMLAFYGFDSSREAKNKGTVAAQKALELDNSLAEAHAALAYANTFWWWEWPDAERDFRRALELDGNYVPAHQWYALYLAAMGRRRESVEEMEKAEALDPLSPVVRIGSGFVHYLAQQYDDAIRECNLALQISPDSMAAHYVLGLSYEAKRDYVHAIPELQKSWQISGEQATVYLAALGHVYGVAGHKDEAQHILSQLETTLNPDTTVNSAKALVWASLGDEQNEIECLGRASKANDPQLIWLAVDPRWQSVRSHPVVQPMLASLQNPRPH